MTVTKETHFDIQRKIISNRTQEGWKNIPHVSSVYEPDVTDFMKKFDSISSKIKISVNTLMLKVIAEGLKAAPQMNAHLDFSRRLVRGCIKEYSEINISMPMILNDGRMMAINLRNFESKSLTEMTEYVDDIRRRMDNTNLDEAMYEVSLDDTLTALKHGKVIQALMRVTGSLIGKHKIPVLKGAKKRKYEQIPECDRLTKYDIEPGTVMISNMGSLYREQRGVLSLMDILPPQVCAFGIEAIQNKPSVITDDDGKNIIAIRKMMPICIAFDHRALDYSDTIPFIKRLDEIFANPDILESWV